MLINWMLRRVWALEDKAREVLTATAERLCQDFNRFWLALEKEPEYRSETVSGKYALQVGLIGGLLLAGIVCAGLVV